MNLVTARYSDMSLVGEFLCEDETIKRGDAVVLQTERGTELGEILKDPAPYSPQAPPAAPEQGEQPPVPETAAPRSEGGEPGAPSKPGSVLRRAVPEDIRKTRDIRQKNCPAEQEYCEKKIRELKLPMKLVHVEHLFGGEKIIFYFIADGRVDFRELVKDLAREYRTRIEMKQIGVRDEARILGDRERCGMQLCCRMFLKSFEPITMKMAKSQKATLDPSKISGHCGRLMCCLRYEDKIYSEYKKKLPKKGSRVITAQGIGEVITYDILAQTVTIETDDRRRLHVSISDITGRDTRGRDNGPQKPPRDRPAAKEKKN